MKKILIAETNIDRYGNSTKQTGIWLEEITSFYDVVTKAGYQVDFGSAKGGRVPVDPASANADPETMRIYADPDFHKAAIEQTKKFSDLHAEDYAAIYFGGGHGAMWDFPDNTDLQKLAENIYENGGYITSVCHGEAGLVNLKDSNGEYLVRGKKINGFTDEEERMNGTDGLVPFLGESALRDHGADFVKGEPYTEFAVADARFVTGQNPFSSTKVAELLVEELARAKAETDSTQNTSEAKDAFMNLAKDRFSVRKFTDQKIDREMLGKILEAGRIAPTAANLQPQRIYVLDSDEAIQKINQLSKCIYGAKTVLLFAYDSNEDWKNPLENGVHSGEQDASIVATHVMLEAWSLGIASCWVNVFPNTQTARSFGLPSSEKPVLLMPIGYAASGVKPSPKHFDKKPLEDTVRYL